MSYEISDRGFKRYEPVKTTYGHVVRVYESSAAMEPHIWLAIDLAAEDCRGGLEPESAHAHCSLEQARQIHAALGAAIANHYQLGS